MSLPLSDLQALLPELALLVLMGLVMLLDLLWHPRRKLGVWTALGLVAVLALSLALAQPSGSQVVWGGILRHDGYSFVFRMLFLVGALVTALLAMDVPHLGDKGAFYLLLLTSTLGMMLMAMANNLIMVFLAVETASIPLYVMAGFYPKDRASAEAGFKYMLFGALASAVLVYGMTLLYGLAGATDFAGVVAGLQQATWPVWMTVAVLLLVLAGFAFKVAAVPFHFWAPDVYTGAPTPIAAYLSTASKAAGFAVLVRFLLAALPGSTLPWWGAFLAAMAAATMTVGNFLALAQRNLKRLLAYSSIAHAGYILIGVVAASHLGVTAAVFYLVVYLLTNLVAFGVVVALESAGGTSEIRSLAGLYKRSPLLALFLMTAFLSLAGVPPFSGFVAKVWVFTAAVEAGLIWLAIVGVLNAIVGLYYYLIVLKVAYVYDAPEEEMHRPVRVPRVQAAALGVLSVLIVVMGLVFAPWFAWGEWAARTLMGG